MIIKVRNAYFYIIFVARNTKGCIDLCCTTYKNQPMKYFVLSTIARAPSIATSVFIGSIGREYNDKRYYFVVTGVLGIFGILYNNKMNSK